MAYIGSVFTVGRGMLCPMVEAGFGEIAENA